MKFHCKDNFNYKLVKKTALKTYELSAVFND
jgi:hypothetical protein